MTRGKGRPPSASAGDAVTRLGARWRDARRRLDEARPAPLDRPGYDTDERINALLGESIALEHFPVRTPPPVSPASRPRSTSP